MLIYNPRAGRILRSDGSLIHRVEEALREAGHAVTPAPTTGPRTAGEIARKHIERGADVIVVAGGDGTVNEAAEGMLGTGVPLAVLPAGTANVLATELKLGRDPVKAARRLAEWVAHPVAAGRLDFTGGETRHFLLMAGIGLDAYIVSKVNSALKARTGKFAYWLAGWSLLGRRLAEIEVEIDGVKRRCGFALFARVRNYGGDFEIARRVTLLEDTFEVVLFEGRNALRYVPYFAGMVVGRLEGTRGVTVVRAREAKIAAVGDERAFVQVDGELGGRIPADVRIVPGAVRLLMPAGFAAPADGRVSAI
ncbi:MAG: diacylglycerol kinase family lipid kinase [Acidobacteriota bacterium]|nr:diacylglycerol kinase family lipid kinase [Acidobacteriota bacterium]